MGFNFVDDQYTVELESFDYFNRINTPVKCLIAHQSVINACMFHVSTNNCMAGRRESACLCRCKISPS